MTARARQPRRVGVAFLLPLLAYLSCSGADRPTRGVDLVLPILTCVLAGAAWQLLHRRDLVDRLTHLASAFVVLAPFVVLLSWEEPLNRAAPTDLLALVGILTGCVYAEQLLRWREHRLARERRAQPADARQVAG